MCFYRIYKYLNNSDSDIANSTKIHMTELDTGQLWRLWIPHSVESWFYTAQLVLDTHAGNAWVDLWVQLGRPSQPYPSLPPAFIITALNPIPQREGDLNIAWSLKSFSLPRLITKSCLYIRYNVTEFVHRKLRNRGKDNYKSNYSEFNMM